MNLYEIVNRNDCMAISQEEALFVIKQYVMIRKGSEITPALRITQPNKLTMVRRSEVQLMVSMTAQACAWLIVNLKA